MGFHKYCSSNLSYQKNIFELIPDANLPSENSDIDELKDYADKLATAIYKLEDPNKTDGQKPGAYHCKIGDCDIWIRGVFHPAKRNLASVTEAYKKGVRKMAPSADLVLLEPGFKDFFNLDGSEITLSDDLQKRLQTIDSKKELPAIPSKRFGKCKYEAEEDTEQNLSRYPDIAYQELQFIEVVDQLPKVYHPGRKDLLDMSKEMAAAIQDEIQTKKPKSIAVMVGVKHAAQVAWFLKNNPF